MHPEASASDHKPSSTSSRPEPYMRPAADQKPARRTMAAVSYWDSGRTSHSRPMMTKAAAARPWCARRPPRPPPARRSVAQWEKDFCESRGVPWRKVTDPDVGLNADAEGKVARWDDSGAVEALLAAKKRYWAEINGGLKVVAPPPPGPGMYCDEIVEGGVDPELDAEYEAALRAMEDAWEENVRLREAVLPDDFVPEPTGWDVDG